MDRTIALALLAALACGESPTEQGGFDVDVRIVTSVASGGCRYTWTATATDPAIAVNWRLGLANSSYPDGWWWVASGVFHEVVSDVAIVAGATTVELRWQLSAGTGFVEDKQANVGCGSTWQES